MTTEERTPHRYLVCGCTPWTRDIFEQKLSKLPGEWRYIDSQEDMHWLADPDPSRMLGQYRAAFFLHWRWKVPKEVLNAVECIGFHFGILPFQRGGTPLQWRILEGNKTARVSMFRMTEEIDAGPIYTSVEVRLDGAAEAIYRRGMEGAAMKIERWLREPWFPEPQDERNAIATRRRRPTESNLWETPFGGPEGDLLAVYDRIRCVDAPGYPLAYLDVGTLRLTFRRAVDYGDRIEADVTIRRREEEP